MMSSPPSPTGKLFDVGGAPKLTPAIFMTCGVGNHR